MADDSGANPLDREAAVTVSVAQLRSVADEFDAKDRLMKWRVVALSTIICGLIVGGALWWIGVLDPGIPGPKQEGSGGVLSTSVSRLGGMAMVIFLVRVLVPLFRYAAELEVFFKSRSAALKLL